MRTVIVALIIRAFAVANIQAVALFSPINLNNLFYFL